jgi:hypothetical protein
LCRKNDGLSAQVWRPADNAGETVYSLYPKGVKDQWENPTVAVGVFSNPQPRTQISRKIAVNASGAGFDDLDGCQVIIHRLSARLPLLIIHPRTLSGAISALGQLAKMVSGSFFR